MKLSDIITKTERLIKDGTKVLLTEKAWESGDGSSVDYPMFNAFRTSSLSFVLKIYGDTHPYYKQFDRSVAGTDPEATQTGIELLQAMKTEFEEGWLTSTKGLISAEIFSDFIEMASHLLSEDYKDAAAVMIGSVLEEHLRQLCEKYEIPIHVEKLEKTVLKKADAMNADLAKGGVYSKLDQKNVAGWLDLRNQAAHGHYSGYQKSQVELMLLGVRDFIARVSL
jgi:hypothetical protein